jgi:hypothetical protein
MLRGLLFMECEHSFCVQHGFKPLERRFYRTGMTELAIGGLKTEHVVVRLFIYTWLLAKSNPI